MRSDLAISTVVHVALLLWCALTFSIAPMVSSTESMPVDIISEKQFSELTKGAKSAPKPEEPKPLVDKVEEPKPNPVETPQMVPTVAEKPEVKPIPKEAPPEPKVEAKPAVTPAEKKAAAKPEPKPDPIAEQIKKEEARQAAEAKAKAKAEKKPQLQFNPDQIAMMLNKQNPQRRPETGQAVNREPTLGVSAGSAAALSQSEIDALRARLMQLWNPPAGAANPQEIIVRVRVRLRSDGTLADGPIVLTSGKGSLFEAARDRAVRALYEAQPFDMLRRDHYELWKEMDITFDPRDMGSG